MSQRSWFSCSSWSSWRLRRADMSGGFLAGDRLAVLGGQIGQEALLDDARVGAGLDREDPLQQQLAVLDLHLADALQLVGDGQPDDVGRHDAPQGGHESAGDEVAEL